MSSQLPSNSMFDLPPADAAPAATSEKKQKEKKAKEAKTEPASPTPTVNSPAAIPGAAGAAGSPDATPAAAAATATAIAAPPAPARSSEPAHRRTLFSLQGEFLAIVARLDAIGEMPTDKGMHADARTKALADVDVEVLRLAQRLEAIDPELDQKIEGWARFIRQIEADEDAADKEAKRLAARSSAFEAQGKSLKTALCNVLDSIGKSKVQTPFATVYTQANQASVEVEDASFIPQTFIKPPPPPEQRVDIKRLSEWIAEGNPAPKGVRYITTRRHLRIK